jgi:hypothetical protein
MTAEHGADLKYSTDVQAITTSGESCPPQNAVETTRNAYHWCANPMTINCFSPVAVKNPKRVHKESDLNEKCSYWGVSMYMSLEASIRAFQSLEKSMRNARKTLGSHVATGELTPSHGRQTSPDEFGHFDLHEYASVDLLPDFQIVQQIPGSGSHA